MQCPVARSLERVGEWWSMLIIRDALAGMTRFDEFQSSLGIAPNMLSRRLNALVTAGLLTRRRYQERPARHEYILTDRGRDFRPVLLALQTWGNRHFAPEGASVVLVDAGTGLPADPVLVDRVTGKLITEATHRNAAGPAAGRRIQRRAQAPHCPSLPRRRPPRRSRAGGRVPTPPARADEAGRARALHRRDSRRRAEPAHAGAAARRDRADLAAHGVAEHPGDAGAGLHRADRDLVGVEARHRCADRHGGGVSRLHDDADAVGRRARRRHFLGDRARARRRPQA